jgi:cobalt-zinc-cadmium efflux system outer membrane protein
MKPRFRSLLVSGACLILLVSSRTAIGQQALTWDQVKAKFEASNPALQADALNVDETKAQEITAFLRPNPQFTASADGTQIAPSQGHWLPLSGDQYVGNLSYLHERDHKRELRLKSAQQATGIARSQHSDLDRTMTFTLRAAFIQTLEAKTVLAMARQDLEYYDHVIQISRDRYNAGDIAQIDLDRIELLRVQYESEIQTAIVNLRTSKIELLQMINDPTPVEQFDVTGTFDFSENLASLEDLRKTALDARPDLRASFQALEQADTNHRLAEANGSTDPTIAAWYTWNPSFNNPYDQQTLGLSVSIPLRIFDKNQGEKKRTQIDIGRNEQLTIAAHTQVFSDVDSAYAQIESDIALLKPYKAKYNAQALRVRDTVTYSYQHGGASLLDLINAQSDFRTVQLAYLQLIGTYLTAAGQLNLAVGREVIQ